MFTFFSKYKWRRFQSNYQRWYFILHRVIVVVIYGIDVCVPIQASSTSLIIITTPKHSSNRAQILLAYIPQWHKNGAEGAVENLIKSWLNILGI